MGVELRYGLRRALHSLRAPPTWQQRSCVASSHRTSRPSKAFSTSTSHRQEPFTAAPEINLSAENNIPILKRIRVVPASPSYFSGKPAFTDDLLALQALLRKYQTLPVVETGHAPRIAWRTFESYKSFLGSEPIKASKYQRLVAILHRLNHIHPSLMPQEVKDAMERYKREINPFANVAKPKPVDEWGRAMGLGRRKTSTARAWLVEGEGEVLVNGGSLAQYFGRLHDRESAVWALKATQRLDKYNVFALVRGGGVTGQAEALTLAVAKALLIHEPGLKPALRRAGCITRDPRKVERKKPGHLKARKMPTWVKR
ncbi:hypothetical protein EJ06DRAFT_534402 [Trichodelitschia bisporula]|uniref:Small ribosomal subunit protein uS9m n=1 Tax=Trichodelitschia bisporula TaxID=703511 RepID=A0A6G1HJK8_9PEZI|nr:hypothetical protein EJ06DRAFT_534402 [Trichodelitschia bisporula]